jgi:hypothetical protein
VKTFARAGVTIGIALVLTLAAHAAFAIEYDDVLNYTKQGVSDRAIVELIVKDGRAFKMSSDERNELRDANVSEIVIRAMDDPSYGQDWLDGKVETPQDFDNGDDPGADDQGTDDRGDDNPGSYDQGQPGDGGAPNTDEDGIVDEGGYSTSLDQAYGNGYANGNTDLVYSFGYYYGPLARYYNCDPFYYPFWSHGYAASYWPSYCAYWWRPRYDWCYAYPYNVYNYNSYYCFTYFDPGYYSHNGYHVLPGYRRTVWDNGPRWRNGGTPPPSGGRPLSRILDTRFAEAGGLGGARRYAPPVIHEAVSAPLRNRMGASPSLGAAIQRTPIDRGTTGQHVAPAADGGRRMSSLGDYLRQRPAGERTQPSIQTQPRVYRGGTAGGNGVRRAFPPQSGWSRGGPHATAGGGVSRFFPSRQAAPAPRSPAPHSNSGGNRGVGGVGAPHPAAPPAEHGGDHGGDHGGGGGGERGRGR